VGIGERGGRIHWTFFRGDFLNFWSFLVNAFFPMATSSFSSGSSDGGLEIRRFFALPDASARPGSLSSVSCTEIFRLIRYDAKLNRMLWKRVRVTRTYPFRLFLFIGEHIDVNSVTAGRGASRAVTLSIRGPGEHRARNGGSAGFARIWGPVQWRGRRGAIRGRVLKTPLHRRGRRCWRLGALGEEGHETLLFEILF